MATITHDYVEFRLFDVPLKNYIQIIMSYVIGCLNYIC